MGSKRAIRSDLPMRVFLSSSSLRRSPHRIAALAATPYPPASLKHPAPLLAKPPPHVYSRA